jgi:hypothetical protein
MTLKMVHATAAMTPERNNQLAALDRFPKNAVSTAFFGVPNLVTSLGCAMACQITMFSSVLALILATTISAPCLQPIKTASANPKFIMRLGFSAL